MPFYWLSFADTDNPKGEHFLGVSIVEVEAQADEKAEAVSAFKESWKRRCNPGGEVQFWRLDIPVPAAFCNRLMKREEAETVRALQ